MMMKVSAAKYTGSGTILALIAGREVSIPDDMANRDRRDLADWEAEGNVIAPYAPPAPTKEQVKAEAARRIELVLPAWMAVREISGGAAIPSEVKAMAQAIRGRSNEIEAMTPIPADFADDSWWLP